MSYFSIEFDVNLWENKYKKFGESVKVLLDTGSFNTAIHNELAARYGTKTNQKMKISVGSYSGDADIFVLHKLPIGECVLEKVITIPFDGELNNHILLGANVLKNWKFIVSSYENHLDIIEMQSCEIILIDTALIIRGRL